MITRKLINDKENILVALHDPATVPDMNAIGLKVQPGKHYEISVMPSVTITVVFALL